MPKKADLIIIETMGTFDAIRLERMIWRMIRYYHSTQTTPPAVAVYNSMHVAGPKRPDMPMPWGLLCAIPPGSNFTECCGNFTSGLQHSWENLELHREMVMQEELGNYYGIASISLRNFLWPYVRDKVWESMGLTWGECEFITLANSDSVHPSRLGTVLIADFLWAYLSKAHQVFVRNSGIEARYPSGSNHTYENLIDRVEATRENPFPQQPFQISGRDVYDMRCYGFLGAEHSIGWVPDITKGDMGKVGRLPIIGGEGFELVLNYTVGNTTKRKPGWVATKPESYMDVELDTLFSSENQQQEEQQGESEGNSSEAMVAATSENTTAVPSTPSFPPPPPPPPPEGPKLVEVVVVFLRSYEHMGMATLSCMSGCTCNPQR